MFFPNAAEPDFDAALASLRATRSTCSRRWAAFGHGVRQVAKLIGQDVTDGKILLSPVMVRYLSSRGLLRPAGEPEKA